LTDVDFSTWKSIAKISTLRVGVRTEEAVRSLAKLPNLEDLGLEHNSVLKESAFLQFRAMVKLRVLRAPTPYRDQLQALANARPELQVFCGFDSTPLVPVSK
jgi:hypothetical protein